MLILLDNIRSTYNVGSIFRTADCAGIAKIYLGGITPAPKDELKRVNQRLTKVSLGAENFVSWEKVPDTLQLIEELKKQNYQILALELAEQAIPYYQIKLTAAQEKKTVLVVGNEVQGLDKTILEKADKILQIPMQGKKESLNVSVAFGIAVFHLRRPFLR